jgi:hypothetical protein
VRKTFTVLALAAVALAGCSEQTSRPRQNCALEVTQICMAAAQIQFTAGVRMVGDKSPAGEVQLVPYVVPVTRPDGALAAEVDCYANTDFSTFSIIHSQVAIAPVSQDAVDFLRERHLCTDVDTGSLARL